MKIRSFIFVFVFMISSPAVQADVESWYTYWAFGFVRHNHPQDLEAFIESAESIPGVDRTQGSLDMFGFYWPIDNNTIGGFVISGSFDSVEDIYNDYIQFNQYLYGASGMRFYGKEIGDGFFLRGDVGFTKLATSSNFLIDEESDWGSGYLLGLGYGIPISWNTRILFSINFSSKSIEGDNYRSTSFNIGGLW